MANEVVSRAHGGGGVKMRGLIDDVFRASFDNEYLNKLNDFARVEVAGATLAITTDTYVVDPWEFPGGNIGDLAICGTVNDLCMSGATPRYLTAGFILPEGFPIDDLRKIVQTMARRAKEAGVLIVTGDTKVVGPGSGPFVNTTGVGEIPPGVDIAGQNARPGDAVMLTGPAGNHGIAVLSKRQGIGFATEVVTDAAPLNHLVAGLLALGLPIHAMRDPTRGGVAGALNEIAAQSGVEIEIAEDAIPIEPGVRSACDLLGYDPLHIANEGSALVIFPREHAQAMLKAAKASPYGVKAAIIGEVRAGQSRVVARTVLGSRRLVDAPSGEILPRIC